MENKIISFILKYKIIFIFYSIIAILVYINRKKIDTQAKIIMLYRTKFGLKAMDSFIKRHRELVILLGYISVGVGFLGMILISFELLKNLYKVLFIEGTASAVSLVLPGINVPGLGVLPFWYWIIAIFFIALIHEFGHGIVARAHNIPVKSSGLVLLGPIIGAFVEPDEKVMSKKSDIVQYSVMAAGPFANILLAIVALLLMIGVGAIHNEMVEPTGFTFSEYAEGNMPAEQVGLLTDVPIVGVDGEESLKFETLAENLYCKSPGDEIILSSFDSEGETKNYTLTLGSNPTDEEKAYVGISNIENDFKIKEEYNYGVWKTAYYVLDWFKGFFKWLFMLSLGIGIFNLLPLPIVDGGRMVQVASQKMKGKDKGNRIYGMIGFFFLALLLVNLFLPLIKNLLEKMI